MEFMDTVANNIANVNTTGYKTQRARFSDMLSQTINAGTDEIDPTQVGLGTQISGVDNMMAQGALQATGNPLDLAVEGDGFFQVTDGTNTYYTRDGAFGFDQSGNLINSTSGMKVMDDQGQPIQIDPSNYVSISIAPSGQITGVKPDGTIETPAKVGLATFKNPGGLSRSGGNLWTQTPASGAAQTDATTNGQGKVRSGMLEGSNVDLAQEFSNMISAERGYQANARVITSSDEILQDLVNIKR